MSGGAGGRSGGAEGRSQLAGRESCVKILLAAPQASTSIMLPQGCGASVLIGAVIHVMDSLRQVGSGDTTRPYLRLAPGLEKGKQPGSYLCHLLHAGALANEHAGRRDRKQWAGPDHTEHGRVTRLLLPVLRAQFMGERRCGTGGAGR